MVSTIPLAPVELSALLTATKRASAFARLAKVVTAASSRSIIVPTFTPVVRYHTPANPAPADKIADNATAVVVDTAKSYIAVEFEDSFREDGGEGIQNAIANEIPAALTAALDTAFTEGVPGTTWTGITSTAVVDATEATWVTALSGITGVNGLVVNSAFLPLFLGAITSDTQNQMQTVIADGQIFFGTVRTYVADLPADVVGYAGNFNFAAGAIGLSATLKYFDAGSSWAQQKTNLDVLYGDTFVGINAVDEADNFVKLVTI
jgi:hypothetical protein